MGKLGRMLKVLGTHPVVQAQDEVSSVLLKKPSYNKLVVSHQDALRLLLSLELADSSFDDSVQRELPAIISHWLQNPHGQVPFVTEEIEFKWMSILRNYCLISRESVPVEVGELDSGSKSLVVDFAIPFPPLKLRHKFKFIDLFAGIGGFRIALQEMGGKCVFSSEWDRYSKQTYYENYGEIPFGDIRQFTGESLSDEDIKNNIPDHDVLAAGFPCQPFSMAGVSARNSLGQNHGFSCKIQGTLFFDLMRIAKAKRPKVLFLENVKNLKSHDGGRTFERIQETIENDLGYSFYSSVIDSSPLVPQKRKRCYMVCFRDKVDFEMPEIMGDPLPLSSILESSPHEKYTLSDKMWLGHQERTKRNLTRGTGFTAHAANLDKPSNTLVARYYKDGKECLVPQRDKNPRLLTPRECARLQGFPEAFRISSVQTQAYRQFGNSVAVPVIGKIAKAVSKKL